MPLAALVDDLWRQTSSAIRGVSALTITSEWANVGLAFISICLTVFLAVAGVIVRYLGNISENQGKMLSEIQLVSHTATDLKTDLHELRTEFVEHKEQVHDIDKRVVALEKTIK